MKRAKTIYDVSLPLGVSLPWYTEISPKAGDPDEQWIYNPGDDPSPTLNQNLPLQAVDSIKAMCLELQYQKLLRSDYSTKYQFVSINPGYTVDLKQGYEFKNSNPSERRRISRDSSQKNLRPYDSFRYKDATPFQLLSANEGKRFEVDRYGWLARQWSSTKKRNPTKKEIMNGILSQDQAMTEAQMGAENLRPEEIQDVVQARFQAWQVFFNVTALGQGDLNEEIDFKSLWRQPAHPIN